MAGRKTELRQKLWRSDMKNLSPDRTVVWSEPRRRIGVMYYLSRNGRLEQPHFMEVPLPSNSQGLILSDVMNRLDALRGQGMASLYSWSCKRRYKNGFVWHDLSDRDFVYPAEGNDEYVLKGSALSGNAFLNNVSHLVRHPSPPPGCRRGGSADLDYHPPGPNRQRRNHTCSSIDIECKSVCDGEAESSAESSAADASTQTVVEHHRAETEISPTPSESSSETLAKLMKSERSMTPPSEMRRHRGIGGEEHIENCRSSILMQLFSRGSMAFKVCGAGQAVALIGHEKGRETRGAGRS